MMRKFMALAVAACAALAITVSASAVPCCWTNGSFETNDVTGWTTSGGGWTSGTAGGGAAPWLGSYYGWANTGGSAGSFGGLSQTKSGPAGRIFGWAKFDNGETGGFCDFNDQARVLVDGAQVFYASSASTGSTGWVKWSVQTNSFGSHTVQAQVLNDSDNLCDSQINLDGVTWDARVVGLGGP